MKSLESRFARFFTVWQSFRLPGQVVPTWKNVKPMQFGNLLPDVMLVKKHGPRDYRYWLLGSAVNIKMGADPVGENFLKYTPLEWHDHIYAWLELVASQPCAAQHEMSLEFEHDDSRSYKGLNLPSEGDTGEIDTFLFYNESWQPLPGENPGKLVSSGKRFFHVEAIDIGAGLPRELPGDKRTAVAGSL